MQLQVVGLGRMDANMALRLLRDGHDVNRFDPNATARERTANREFVRQLTSPRVVCMMVPAADPTDSVRSIKKP